jgi:hypothetical protein
LRSLCACTDSLMFVHVFAVLGMDVHCSTVLLANRECGISAARAPSRRPLQMIMGKLSTGRPCTHMRHPPQKHEPCRHLKKKQIRRLIPTSAVKGRLRVRDGMQSCSSRPSQTTSRRFWFAKPLLRGAFRRSGETLGARRRWPRCAGVNQLHTSAKRIRPSASRRMASRLSSCVSWLCTTPEVASESMACQPGCNGITWPPSSTSIHLVQSYLPAIHYGLPVFAILSAHACTWASLPTICVLTCTSGV